MSTSAHDSVPPHPRSVEFADAVGRIARARRPDVRSYEGFSVIRTARLPALRLPATDGGAGLS
ncbi:MAG: hypothetical protein QM673_06115, partial [Gordonia sp. (in: high G+C Gram-positive bacteria)]